MMNLNDDDDDDDDDDGDDDGDSDHTHRVERHGHRANEDVGHSKGGDEVVRWLPDLRWS